MKLALAIALLLLLVLFLLRRHGQHEDDVIMEAAAQMSREELEKGFDLCCDAIVRHIADPQYSGVSEQQAKSYLTRATYYRDRLNALDGQSHGRSFRANYRNQLHKSLQEQARLHPPD